MRATIIGLLGIFLAASLAAQEAPRKPSSWNVTVGPGVFVFPRYAGSDEYRVLPFPLLHVSFRDRVFLGPSTTGLGFALGAYAVRTSRLGIAVEVGGQDSRPASRAAALAGLDDRDGVGTVGASVSYRIGAVEAVAGATKGINDGAGVLATARLGYTRVLGPVVMSVGASAGFADAKQMRREFGVTETEAARRSVLIAAGDDRLWPGDGVAYRPRGGLRHLGASIFLAYPLSPRWSVIGFGGIERLSSEAAASPLVRRRTQFAGGIGLGYSL